MIGLADVWYTILATLDKPSMLLWHLPTLWKKQQVSRACQFISSQDPVVRHVVWTIKEEKSSHVKFTPMVAARDALTVDPGMVRKKLTKVATTIIVDDDSKDRFSAMVSSENKLGLCI